MKKWFCRPQFLGVKRANRQRLIERCIFGLVLVAILTGVWLSDPCNRWWNDDVWCKIKNN